MSTNNAGHIIDAMSGLGPLDSPMNRSVVNNDKNLVETSKERYAFVHAAVIDS